MKKTYAFDQTLKNQNYTEIRLHKGEYENCIFDGCDFSNGYLDNQNFAECEFIDCNLSNANIAHTIFNDVVFSHCKMMGLKFETLNDFLLSFRFNDCTLNLSSFYQMQLKNIQFVECKFVEADFTEANLTKALFGNCDLKNTVFENSILQEVDFRTAYNLSFDPDKNRIKKAKFSKEGALGLLAKYGIDIE